MLDDVLRRFKTEHVVISLLDPFDVEKVCNSVPVDALVVYDMISEAFPKHFLDYTMEITSRLSLRKDQVVYVCSAVPCKTNNEVFKRYVGDHRLIYASVWPNTAIIYNNNISIQRGTKLKSKLFTCLFGGPRENRIAVVAILIKHRFLDKAFISMRDFPDENSFMIMDDEMRKIIKDNEKLFPTNLSYDVACYFSIRPHEEHYYTDAYVSIIGETLYHSSDQYKFAPSLSCQFLTEKTYRTIMAQHPFIMVSTPNLLKDFRDLGYKTFHPFINESYDDIVDDIERMYAIEKEMLRLAAFSDAEWINFQRNVRPILTHNVIHLQKNHRYIKTNYMEDNILGYLDTKKP